MANKTLNIKVNATADSSKVTNLAKELDKLVDKSEQAEQELKKLGIEGSNAGKEINEGARTAERSIEEIAREAQFAHNAFTQMGDVGRISETEIANEATKTGLTLREQLGGAVDSVKQKFHGLSGSFGAETGAIKQQMQGMGTASRLFYGSLENFGGMVIYNALAGFVEMGKASMNAEGQLDYFGKRLDLSAEQSAKFRNQLTSLQDDFKKVNMRQVGATAEEIALKMNLPKDKIGDLTKMTAVLSSTFVKEGRTQEDAVLAVGDALDGQFKRLQEIGITQDKLKENGWNGNLEDQAGLIDALNKTMEKMGYEQTAKDITNLDDAMTALNVAGGNLIASILIPMTPTLVALSMALINVFDELKSLSGMFVRAFQGMPDEAKIILLATAFGLLGLYIKLSLIPSLISSSIAFINWIATALGAEVSAFTLSGAFSLLGTTIWGALAPLLPFIIAFGLIALAVYEVGKAFGWWSDIGTMLEAIQAGVTRLWKAFINNPNVKATIEDIKNMLNDLGSFLSWVGGEIGKAWNSMFPKSSGEFDIVRAIIDLFGEIGNWGGQVVNALTSVGGAFDIFTSILGVIAGPVGMILSILKPIICILLGCSPGIVPALEKVQEMFVEVFSFISGFIGSNINIIVSAVQSLINIFVAFLNGQMSLPQLVMNVWNILTNGLFAIFNNTIARVTSFGSSMTSKMYNTAVQSVNNFTNQIKSLPSKLQAELTQMLSAVNTWASTLPQKFWNAGVNAVKNFLSALGIASPGTMQRMLVWEITEMGNRVPKESKNLISNIGQLGSDIVDEFNPSLEIGNSALSDTGNNNGGFGNNIEININVGSVDNEERVNEIVDAVTKVLTWNNITAGRSI